MPLQTKVSFDLQESGEILVIDDDSSSLYLITELLTSMGMGNRVTTASTAEEALDVIQNSIGTEKFPSLLLLDIKMPGADGFEFLEKLDQLSIPAHEEPKVVLLSYYGNRQYQARAAEHGVSDYLRKPLTREKVLDIISRYNSSN